MLGKTMRLEGCEVVRLWDCEFFTSALLKKIP